MLIYPAAQSMADKMSKDESAKEKGQHAALCGQSASSFVPGTDVMWVTRCPIDALQSS